MEKLGKILKPSADFTAHFDSSISGDGVGTPIGVYPSAMPYNETLIFSATGQVRSGECSEAASNFQRLRLHCGPSGEGANYIEIASPSAEGDVSNFNYQCGGGTALYQVNGCFKWTSLSGFKTWAGVAFTYNNATTYSRMQKTSADTTDVWPSYVCSEIWGINRRQ